jgi:hypothetical protein
MSRVLLFFFIYKMLIKFEKVGFEQQAKCTLIHVYSRLLLTSIYLDL